MKSLILTSSLGLALAGCTSSTGGARPMQPIPITYGTVGLERVMGQDARALTTLLGKPNADVQEGLGRKLQFGSELCVLDAYLYRPANNRGEPVVSHVDARQRDGSSIDRASCVAAIVRREGGK